MKHLLAAFLTIGLLATPVDAGPRRGGSGTYNRQGTTTWSNGRTSTWQGQNTWSRGNGAAQSTYSGSRTGPNGNTSSVQRQNSITNTGDGTYSRQGAQTVTAPNGQTRTRTYQGSGTVQKTDNGYTKTYDGSVTTQGGKTLNVDKTVDVTKNSDGTVTKDRSVEYTTPDGRPVGSGSATTTVTPGQGATTTGSYTPAGNGATRQYNGTTTREGNRTSTSTRQVTVPDGSTPSPQP